MVRLSGICLPVKIMANTNSNVVAATHSTGSPAGVGAGHSQSSSAGAEELSGNLTSDQFAARLAQNRVAGSQSASNGVQQSKSSKRQAQAGGRSSEPNGNAGVNGDGNSNLARSSGAAHGQGGEGDGEVNGEATEPEYDFYGQKQSTEGGTHEADEGGELDSADGGAGDSGESASAEGEGTDDGGDASDGADQDQAPKKGSAQARIRELVAQRKAAEAALASVQQRLAALEAGKNKNGAQGAPEVAGIGNGDPRLTAFDSKIAQSQSWLALAAQLKAAADEGSTEPITVKVDGQDRQYSPEQHAEIAEFHNRQLLKLETQRELVAAQVAQEHQAKLVEGRKKAADVYPWLHWSPPPGTAPEVAHQMAPPEWRLAKGVIDTLRQTNEGRLAVQAMMQHPEGDLWMGRMAAGLAAEQRSLRMAKAGAASGRGTASAQRNPPRVSVSAGAAPVTRSRVQGDATVIEERARTEGRLSAEDMIRVLRGRNGVAQN